MAFIRVQDVCKTYHLGEIDVPVLKGVTFSIERGELVALVGASGSGKTTLMNLLGCLDRPTSGEYWLDGEEMSRLSPDERAIVRTSKIGFVFQNFNLLPRTPALNNVLMPLDYSVNQPTLHEARRRAHDLLVRVGLADRLDHQPSQMSGGQQQRVAIARSLINKPGLVLADEPTGNLDSHTSVEILQMFRELNRAGLTVIIVTHDPKVAGFADRTIRVSDGLIEADETKDKAPMVLLPLAGHNGADGNGATTNGNAAADAQLNGNGDRNGANGHSAADWGGGAGQQQGAAVGVITAPAATATQALPTTRTAPATSATLAEAADDDPLPLQTRLALLFPAPLRTAFSDLRRNKLRSALTALGIIIGVGAVIAMMEIGQGSKSQIQKTIASMGANNLMIQSGASTSGGVNFGIGSVPTLTPEDADEIRKRCPAIDEVSPTVRARAQIVFGNRNWVPFNILGTTPELLYVRDWQDMDQGEMFTDRDVVTGNQVCVIGQTLARELFQGKSPLGEQIRIRNVSLRVIGVLSRKGANTMGVDQDDIVMAPWTTIKYRIAGNSAGNVNQSAATATDPSQKVNTLSNLYPGSAPLYLVPSAAQQANSPQPVRFINVDQIQVKVVSADQIPSAIKQVTDLLRERHRIRPNALGEYADDFNIRDMTEMGERLASTSREIGTLLLFVATISLIVGGVGIMNIMLVSVTERTREIGLRMAVGARAHHIMKQFLTEAVVLCLLGGIIGILAGRGASLLAQHFKGYPIQASIPAIVIAFAASVTVGVVFGFYPAWKASRLDPIEALRYE